jgi:hypothetical protein
MKHEFFRRFSINAQMSNSLKIRRVGDELFPADRETDGGTDVTNGGRDVTDGGRDVTNLVVSLRNSANAPKTSILSFVALSDSFRLISIQ